MKLILSILLGFEKTSDIALENLALRQQVAAMKRSIKRPQLRSRDRLFWVLLFRFWSNWRQALIIVKPDTVVRMIEPIMASAKTLRLNVRFSPGQPKVARSSSFPGSVDSITATNGKRLHKRIFFYLLSCFLGSIGSQSSFLVGI